MNPMLRRGLIALAVLILGVLAALAFVVARFDGEQVKTLAAQWVKSEYQRTLVLDGPLELSVWPRAALQVQGLSLSEAASSERFLAVQRAALAVRVWPLLSGKLVVDRVDLVGVQATLTRDAQGRRNVDDLLGRDGQAAGPAPSGAAPTPAPASPASRSQALRFDVSGVTLREVSLRVQDSIAQVDGQVDITEFTSGRIARGLETPVTLRTRVDLRQPAVKGELSGSASVTPDFDTGRLQLRAQALRFDGDLPGASALQLQVGGALSWDPTQQTVGATGLTVALKGRIAGITITEAALAVGSLQASVTPQGGSLEGVTVKLRGQRGADPLALDLSWPRVELTQGKFTGSALQGALSLGGAQPLQVDFKAAAPAGDLERIDIGRVDATLSSSAGPRSVRANAHAALELSPKARQFALTDLRVDGRVEQPGLQPLILAVSGSADGSPTAARWTLSGQASGNRFDSQGKAQLDGTRPRVEMVARFDSLNLDTLLPPRAAVPAAPAPAPDPAVDLTALNAIDGRFSVSAGHLVTQRVAVERLRVIASLTGGHLTVSTLDARVWDGRVQGSAQAWARDSRIAVKAQADGVDINALLRALAGKDLLEGRGRVSIDLSSQGERVSQLRSNLAGDAALSLRDGAIKGVNLAKSFRQAKAVLTQREDVAVNASRDEKTDFSALDASFRVRAGVARSDDLSMKSPFLRLSGAGEIDVGRSRIDYTVRATVADTSKGQGGAELAALRGLTIPVLLSGPLDAVNWKIQWSAVAAEAAKARVQDKVLEKLGLPRGDGQDKPASAKDALKEKLLKGLFR